jgi:hypothetical protein
LILHFSLLISIFVEEQKQLNQPIMSKMSISVKLKKNKTLFLSDLKRRNIESRMTALRTVLRKANATEVKFITKNFTDEVNCLFKFKGHVAKSLVLYKKSKASKKKSK